MADALGNPTGFALSPGQAHDLDGADALLPDLAAAESGVKRNIPGALW